MFKEEIKATALNTPVADECFNGRIDCDHWRSDVMMSAVCRCLFDKRLSKGERIYVKTNSVYYGGENFDVSPFVNAAKNLKDGNLLIFSISVRKDDSGKWIPNVKSALGASGLYEMEDLENWFLKSGNTKAVIYTNKPHVNKVPKSPTDNTKTIVVVENLITTRWHLLCGLIPRMLSKWFQDIPRTQEEQELLLSVQYDKSDSFQNCISAYANTLDLRGMNIRKMLSDFETKYEKERLEELRKETSRLDRQMDDYMRKYGELLQRKDDILSTLFGFEMRSKDVEPVTMNYFLATKNLVLKKVTKDYIDFYASAWFTNWNPDDAKLIFGKDHCGAWLEYNRNFGFPDNDAKMLYRALFIDEVVRVRLWSHFSVNLRGEEPMRIHGGESCPGDIQNALPNPHHQYNSCGGGNRRYVAECIRRRDIVGAVEQCISATAGINLQENASYRYFTRDLFDPNFGAVIYVNELNQFMTTKDAIKWLKENYVKKEKTEAKEEK